jgi:xylulokinase
MLGSHDQIVNALACGVHRPGDAMDGTGTTECIEPLFADIPENMDYIRENYACVPYLDGRGYVTYAYNTSGGAVVKWYRDQLAQHLKDQAKAEGVSIYDILNRVCPTEPGELMILPYLYGMGGTPDIETAARGVFWGVSMSTGLPEIYRAILEGITFEMAYNLERLEHYGAAPERLYACGGGARSKIWLQIKADVWNREILPVETEETGALGSAILGFAAVTGEKDRCKLAEKFVRVGEPVKPNPEHVKIYQEKFKKYKRLRKMMLDEVRGN